MPIGADAINPVNGARIPIWIADYVLATYGTGAIMAVPAHDERDFEFATRFGLPIVRVIMPRDGDPNEPLTEAFVDKAADVAAPKPGGLHGAFKDIRTDLLGNEAVNELVMVNSGRFDGRTAADAYDDIVDMLAEQGKGRHAVTYRLRDWLISRQRYWGTPIPIIYCEACGTVPVPEADLPVLLPDTVDYRGQRREPAQPRRDVPQRRLPAVRRPPRGARRTRWTRSSTRPGTGSATCRPTTTSRRWTRSSSAGGRPSTSTPAAPSTR